jgi:excisionase family DNA binding protein
MLNVELRILSNGRPITVEELIDQVAMRVVERIKQEQRQPAAKGKVPIKGTAPEKSDPIVVSVKEAPRLLSLGRSTIWRMIKSNQLTAVRVGGRTVIRMDSIRALLMEGEDGPFGGAGT